jgi:hypothetical protein
MRPLLLTTLVLPVLFTLAGPLGPFPGGRLSGDVADTGTVASWDFVDDTETCQLESNPADPHSVNTWCTGHSGNLYVPTSMILGPKIPTERGWVQNVQADPRVRVRIGERVYEARAVRVTRDDEIEAVRAALEKKYALDPADRDAEREIWYYRMEPR